MSLVPSLVPLRVGVWVGSLGGGSFSRSIAKALIARAPDGLVCEFIEIRDLPSYRDDLEASAPRAWHLFRGAISEIDALLVVTPDYHAAMPDCLMNAIAVASHPDGASMLQNLPAAVVSVSPYSLGGFGAQHALSTALADEDMVVMRRPDGYVGRVADVVTADGRITRKKTDAALTKFMAAFGRWVAAQGRRPQLPADDVRDSAPVFYVDGGVFAPLANAAAPDRQASLFPRNG